jgi:endonuclease YncB( thermonuclease family)
MLRNLRRASVPVFVIGLSVFAPACVSSSTPEESSNTPGPPTIDSSPDNIALFSEYDCLDKNVGQTGGAPGQLIEFSSNDRFQDDEARSLLFHGLNVGTIIRLYDDPAGDISDDWVDILVKREVESYCVISFETTFEDSVISITYSEVDGLDAEVSLMMVASTIVEVQPAIEDPTPTIEPASAVTPTLMPTFAPFPAIPPIPEAECIPIATEREFATVSNVVDGDTIDVSIDGVSFRVHYIGVDAPEVGEPYSSQAVGQNAELVHGTTVTLVKDASHTDEEGSLLRFVVSGNQFVNYELVRQGFAIASTIPPDVACSAILEEAQNMAVRERVGLWAGMPTPLSPTHTPASTANIQITLIRFDGTVPGAESDEFVQITNQGSTAVNLQGWRLNAGEPEQDFYFPDFLLDPELSCRLYTNEDHPEYCGMSFGIDREIWNNGGDCGYLYNDEGAQVSKYCY